MNTFFKKYSEYPINLGHTYRGDKCKWTPCNIWEILILLGIL